MCFPGFVDEAWNEDLPNPRLLFSDLQLESPTVSSDVSEAPPRRKRKTALILTALLVVVLLALPVLGIVHLFGYVFGTEFSPQTFQERSFHYYTIPGLGFQLGATTKTDSNTALTRMIAKKYIPVKTKAKAKQWDPVWIHHGPKTYPDGDAKILLDYLHAVNENGDFAWLEWSDDRPKLAKILWPEIVRVAQHHEYTFVPDMMRLALEAQDPKVFLAELDILLAARYRRRGEQLRDLGERARATKLFAEATRLAADD